jgi:hypothetical protein
MIRVIRGASLLILCAGASLEAQQVDTIRVGSSVLHGARPPLGSQFTESFARADGVDHPISTTTQGITRGRHGNQDVYVIHTTHASAAGDTTVGTIVIRHPDFALLHHKVTAAHDSAAVTANSGHLTGWVVLPDQPIRLIDQALDHPVFPIEGQIPWLFPLLPLREGYAAAIPHFSEWQGGEEWTTIRVVGDEPLEHGGRVLDCWKVDGGELGPPGYRAMYWVDKSTRRIMQGVLRGEGAGPEYWAITRMP